MPTANPNATPADDDENRSARGTRLNRRGIESRRRFLDAAIDALAEDGPSAASANLVAKRAGVTWGTIQHQFGDADGVWAAVLEELIQRTSRLATHISPADAPVAERVTAVIDLMWDGYSTPGARAANNLRLALPRDNATLVTDYPKTAATLQRWDQEWDQLWAGLFDQLPVSTAKVRRLRSFVPAALRGIRAQADLASFADPLENRQVLTEAVIAYLQQAAPSETDAEPGRG